MQKTNIPLAEFESCFSDAVLKRALALFKKSALGPIDCIDTDEYLLEIKDKDIYEISYKLRNEVMVACSCTCADFTINRQICAHIAAIFFELNNELFAAEIEKPGRAKTAKKTEKNEPKKVQTILQQAQEIVKNLNEKELRDFILKNLVKQKELQSLVLRDFSHLLQNEDRQYYREFLSSIIKANSSGRRILTGKISRINSAFKEMLIKAQKNIAEGNYGQAAECVFGVLDGIDMVLQMQCNSLQGTINKLDEVLALLAELSHLAHEPELHSHLLNHALISISSNQYKTEMIRQKIAHIALQLATSKPHITLLLSHFQTYLENNPHYRANKSLAIDMVKAAKSYLDKKAYTDLLRKYKSISEVRKELAEYLMAKDRLQAVKKLANEYLNRRRNNKQYKGYFYTQLLKVAIREKSDNILSMAIKAIPQNTEEVLQIVIQLYGDSKWKKERTSFIAAVQTQWPEYPTLISTLYALEGMKEELWAYIKNLDSPDQYAIWGEVYIADKDKNLLKKYKSLLHKSFAMYRSREVLYRLHLLYQVKKYDTVAEYNIRHAKMLDICRYNEKAIRYINKIKEGKFYPDKLPGINKYVPDHLALLAKLMND